MDLTIENEPYGIKGEKQFRMVEYGESGIEIVVHPWARDYGESPIDRQVYIRVGEIGADVDNYECLIVDRAKFVEGLLATFDELQLKEEK